MSFKSLTFAGAIALLSFDSNAAISMAAYEAMALRDAQAAGRCTSKPTSYTEVKARIDFALGMGLITQRASFWAKAYSYYPVVDTYTRSVLAICRG
ncbi:MULTISPECIES: hypothetical protein [Pseudoalteromonas]|uniref:Uncharacterized protein n=1 Tax=Pseudoalteromonas luteoviolacea (strain 2ta16) TaxID=1353533 RepID=V4JAK9_PSEL2|nr:MULTISPECIES: hypothetical protein [Pseudoalteromonas]ESP92217.1 hypothetical protein PL2TA16_05054 [Pseudoalteromonas luteoviolacea 2ta16]KZN29325.1 hypothetical protein N483_07775 [Pseudoalteromonas luteoviolacea NCIMB 1944]MCG7549345.1 hypothetical protein [Pseudoalteromonas sp. Of7M-16]